MQNSKLHQLITFDNQYKRDCQVLIGIDEAGRGPLCGPVVAAAVVLPDIDEKFMQAFALLNDSKKFAGKEAKREELYKKLVDTGCIYAIEEGSLEEIQECNIFQSTYLTMNRAFQKVINQLPNGTTVTVLVDGPKKIAYLSDEISQIPIIKGDAQSASIAAASILAKVYRDNLLIEMAKEFPEYKWEKNKGYGTKDHIEAIRTYGRCKYHRLGFKVKGLDL